MVPNVGMDVIAVREACDDVVKYVRQGSGPVLLECRCYRYQGHSMTDPGRYRSEAEADLWRKRDPILRLAKQLLAQGVEQERLDALLKEVDEIVVDAMRYAEESPVPEPAALYEDLYVDSTGA